jgi:hypothetical protein
VSTATEPPDLGSQMESIMIFINNNGSIRHIALVMSNMTDGNPPKCENSDGPVIFDGAIAFTIVKNNLHHCPYCSIPQAMSSIRIGATTHCWKCGGVFVKSSS